MADPFPVCPADSVTSTKPREMCRLWRAHLSGLPRQMQTHLMVEHVRAFKFIPCFSGQPISLDFWGADFKEWCVRCQLTEFAG